MITENLPSLKINKLTQAQYDAAKAAGNINENELYMTPDSSEEELNSHTGNTTVHITAAERTKWNQAMTDVGTLSEEIANYLPKNQGSANVGKILVVGTDGNLTLTDMPEGGASGDVVGTLDEANNILLIGNLADGTYTLKYLNEDGTYTEVGTLEVGAIPEPEPVKTNFFDASQGFVGRLSSKGADRTDSTHTFVTNYIAVQKDDIVEISGCAIKVWLSETEYNNGGKALYMTGYDSSKTNVYTDQTYETNAYWSVDSLTDNYAKLTVLDSNIAYFRFVCCSEHRAWIGVVDTSKIVINIKRNGEYL